MIEIVGLSVEFAGRRIRALDAVDLRVRSGERVALVGASGAGKTTLLRALVGAVTPQQGTVRVDGHDPSGPPRDARRVRRRCGMIRQGDDLVRGVSARANIAMGATSEWSMLDWTRVARGRTPLRLASRLEQLALAYGIADRLDDRVEHLSGGQRQRVAVCRALLGRPGLLLADEPTTGLDPVSAAAVVDILLGAEAATVVVSTHDLLLAARFDRVVALRDGRIVHDGGAIGPDLEVTIYGRRDRSQDGSHGGAV